MPLTIYREKVRNVIGIAAGKGGVGKSTVTVNLAHALKNMGRSVGVLDADLYGPSIRHMMPEDTLPTQKGGKLFPAYSSGMPVISMAYFHKEAAMMRAPLATSFIRQFLDQIEWGTLDYLLIDFPPGTGDIPLTLGQHAKITNALMVTTPQEISTLDVGKAIQLFRELNIPIKGIVENMSYYLHPSTQEKIALFGVGGGKQLADATSLPYLGEIPLDPSIAAHSEKGVPSCHPAFHALALRI